MSDLQPAELSPELLTLPVNSQNRYIPPFPCSGCELSFSFPYAARYPRGGIHALPVDGGGDSEANLMVYSHL